MQASSVCLVASLKLAVLSTRHMSIMRSVHPGGRLQRGADQRALWRLLYLCGAARSAGHPLHQGGHEFSSAPFVLHISTVVHHACQHQVAIAGLAVFTQSTSRELRKIKASSLCCGPVVTAPAVTAEHAEHVINHTTSLCAGHAEPIDVQPRQGGAAVAAGGVRRRRRHRRRRLRHGLAHLRLDRCSCSERFVCARHSFGPAHGGCGSTACLRDTAVGSLRRRLRRSATTHVGPVQLNSRMFGASVPAVRAVQALQVASCLRSKS